MITALAVDKRKGTGLHKLARGDATAAVVLLLICLATRGIWFGNPVADYDEQLYSYIGWRLTEGELPYVDWWDHKPFGLFTIFALAHVLMGSGPFAYQALGALFALAGAGQVYLLARDLVGRFSATTAGAIYLMLTAAYGSHSGQSEIFFMPFMLAMVWLLRDPSHERFAARALWAMVAGGLALQVKYTVLPQCLFFGAWALWHVWRRGRDLLRLARTALAFVSLGLLPTAGIAMFYALQGQFDAFAFANFLSFFERIPAPQGRWIASHALGVAPLAVLAASGLYAAFRIQPPRDWARYRFYILWAAASIATVLLPGTVYLYYYAALAAPAALIALPLLDRSGPLRGAPALFLVLACGAILALPERRAESLAEKEAVRQLAAAIAPHVGARTDCLWLFDGPTALYRMTGSCVPTRFVYPDHLNNALESEALGVAQDAEVARILASRPSAIVTADSPMTVQNPAAHALVDAALARDYTATLTVPMHGRNLTAWARRAD